jgi:peptidoglycan/xylan/chitin deacetylase (PgdA/CDA1 family)
MRVASLPLLALLCAAATFAQQPSPARPASAVALTFDDLPAVSTRGEARTWVGITDGLLRTLQQNRAPAIGFINEGKVWHDGRRDTARVRLLRRWLDAGLDLGNHTWSHNSLHARRLAWYQQDIVRGDSLLRELLAERNRTPRWFRHPQLHTGRDLETKRGLAAFLEQRGYRIAPVTIDNSDWIFARAYDHLLDRHDSAQARRLERDYLTYMDTVFGYYAAQSRALLGYELPQVLLLHANRLNAACLDELLAAMRRRGYRFITLEEAMRDPAYARADTYTGPAGITWLHRWAMAEGKSGAFFKGEPTVPDWVNQLAGVS